MFTRTTPNRAENDDGVTVTTTGEFSLEYREGERLLRLMVEGGWDEKDSFYYIVTLTLPLRWHTPHEHEVITGEDLERIKKNLTDATRTDDNSRVVFEYTGDGTVPQ